MLSFAALTCQLTHASHDTSREGPCYITFSIVSLDTARTAAERQMEEVVGQVDSNIRHHRRPRWLKGLLKGVDDADSEMANLESGIDTWTPLLANVKKFTDIVDHIAEVRYYRLRRGLVMTHYSYRSTLTQRWRGVFCQLPIRCVELEFHLLFVS